MAGTWPLGRDSVMIWRLHGKELQLTSPVLPPSPELWDIVKKLYPYALAIQFVEDHETAFDDAGRTKAFDYLMKHAQRYPGWFPEEELGKHAGDLSPFVKVSREPIAEFGRDLYEIMSQMPQPALLFTPCEDYPELDDGWWKLWSFCRVIGAIDANTIHALGPYSFFLPGKEDAPEG